MKKRLFALLLAGTMAASLIACGGPSDTTDTTPSGTQESTQQSSESNSEESNSEETTPPADEAADRKSVV